MFTTTPVPTLSTTTATTAQSPPTSPTRTSRLRGLSYLRNYTQNLHGRSDSDSASRNTRPAFPRARSQPSSDSVRHQTSSHDTPAPASAGFPPSTSTSAPGGRAASPLGSARNATATTTNTSTTTTTTTSQTPSSTASTPAASGWVPSGNKSDGTPRSRIRQQSTSDETPSSAPAPTVTTPAESTPARAAMTRSRADTTGPVLTVRKQSGPRSSSADASDSASQARANPLPTIRFIPHFDPRANRPSLSFPAVTRTLPTPNSVIKVGRYSERENAPDSLPANGSVPSSAPVGFKSKVVSRRHCEFWCQNNQWYVRDVKSSSGTFLNHVRLSPPGQESRAFAVNDGDVIQLGIDFRGGEEMIFRCVKIRIECNRGWQKHPNNFNKKTHKQLLARQKGTKDATSQRDSDTASVNSSECSICLMSIAPCQSLFVAPCSHVWHYKCIRPILNGHTWPNFLCPNCRAVADLEAEVDEQEEDEGDWQEDDDLADAIAASTAAESASAAAGPSNSGSSGHTSAAAVSDEPEGQRTPRAMQPARHRDGSSEDDDVSNLALHALSLTETSTNNPPHSSEDDTPPEDDEHATQVDISEDASGAAAVSGPRAIPAAARTLDLTPGGALNSESVLTPRNDIGPFVLDGGAGRSTTGGPRNVAPASLDSVAGGSQSS
ncbi:uncharacterized protein PV09_08375 [Verruconis gallopava]|uniref:FHA domain-containing protein n=1 Tax=Verruconis gallopava TaxID=253628 RepID=A0A0D2A094_9PEZI|nr:uncharacterized protein PV09_08375 [Verruconis gallopava]KIW00023.1 hypothetical protein PV09_08375 [Verruconis gallopava]